MKKQSRLLLVCLLICNSCLYAEVNILAYGDHADLLAGPLSGIDGLTATWTYSLDDITPENLANYDVFYACTSYKNTLDPKADILQDFMMGGGGVVVGQSNVEGNINWLPTELSIYVDTNEYPSDKTFQLTPAGQLHPIMQGMTVNDLGGRPADTIYDYDLAPSWELLMVYVPDPSIIGMAVSQYGCGRVIFWPSHYAPYSSSGTDPSPQLVKQAFEWVAVPQSPVIVTQIIPIDIKPGSCPNPLNVKSLGMLPVAILGSDVLNVNDIDIASIEILGVGPIRSGMEDVATPVAEEALPEDCLCTDEGPDGYMDLVLKFDTQEILEVIGEVEDGDYIILTVTGYLKDEIPFEGTDCVSIIKKGRQK